MSGVNIASATEAGIRNVTTTQPSSMSTICSVDGFRFKILAIHFFKLVDFGKTAGNFNIISFLEPSLFFSRGLI